MLGLRPPRRFVIEPTAVATPPIAAPPMATLPSATEDAALDAAPTVEAAVAAAAPTSVLGLPASDLSSEYS